MKSTFNRRLVRRSVGQICFFTFLISFFGCTNQRSQLGNSSSPSTSLSSGCSTSSGIAAYFPCSTYFNQNISGVTLSVQQKTYSSDIINNLITNGGWGTGKLQVTPEFSIYTTNPTAPPNYYTIDTSAGWITPDSDIYTPHAAGASPSAAKIAAPPGITSNTAIAPGFESSTGETCDGSDCHYLAVDTINQKLIEVYQANASGSVMSTSGGGGVSIWPFSQVWASDYRGDTCTSADAGGFMIAPMTFSAAELSGGAINHAIRLILPNSRIANRTYVRPATHTTGSTGWATAPTSGAADPFAQSGVPYGSLFRLLPSCPAGMTESTPLTCINLSQHANLSAADIVLITALQKYGMYLADGGNIAFTGQQDVASFWPNGFSQWQFLTPAYFQVMPPPAFPTTSNGKIVVDSTGASTNVNVAGSLNCNRQSYGNLMTW